MRVLVLANHRPGRAPGQRFRFEQYLAYLQKHQIECDYRWLLNERDDRWFYGGALGQKAIVGTKALLQRIREVLDGTLRRADVVFVFREALFAGPPLFEHLAKRFKKPLVFDYDDAIWVPTVSEANRRLAWLKWSTKTDEVLALADLALAGNEYLAAHARPLCRRVEVVPTTIDTEEYQRRPVRAPGPVCIGWSGSFSTLPHFETALPALRAVKAQFGSGVTFKVIGDSRYSHSELGIQGQAWRLESEVRDLQGIDIGIMPLPNDVWSRGKCGLKGLQYMALEIPTVMSPVGVNASIIRHGQNGFLAENADAWVARLSELVQDADLRSRLGRAGRQTVVESFSVRAWRDRYVELFRSLG